MSTFVINPYTIHRRGPIMIQCQFDLDGSESSINQSFMELRIIEKIIDETTLERRVFMSKGTSMKKTILDDGSSYWSLVSDGGWFEYKLKEEVPALLEVIYDYANPGTGQLDLWVNGVLTDISYGPSTWSTSKPHKALETVEIRGRQRNFGVSDPPGRGELDNLCIYRYSEIDCEMFEYLPPRTNMTPRAVETLRGYTRYQNTQYLGTEIATTLRFFSSASHTEFLVNVAAPHVICDDKGTFYRGVIELGECRRVGNEIYEQAIVFRSPNKLGEGWI